jgi:hypothetical protein
VSMNPREAGEEVQASSDVGSTFARFENGSAAAVSADAASGMLSVTVMATVVVTIQADSEYL